jgi:S-adenosyl methyltransferase
MAPGSSLIVSHRTGEFAYEKMHEGPAHFKRRGGIFVPRGRDAILRMFNGRELLEPRLVPVSHWRPDRPDPNADRVMAYGGIAAR